MHPDAGAAGPARRSRRPRTLLVTAAAAVLLVGGATAVAIGLVGRDAAVPPPLVAGATASPTTAAPSSPVPTAAAPSGPPPAPVASQVPAAPAALPVRVDIPAIGVSSSLLHLGLRPDGSLEVPQGPEFDSAAWYDGSPRPGDIGPSVLEGHVSSAARGPSVFFDVARLTVGQRVDVLREDGTTASFEVYDLQQFPKDGFPTFAVYGNTAGPELRLITCGGTIAESTGRFDDNVVVFARLVQG